MSDRTPLTPPDADAAERMWAEYAAARPTQAAAGPEHVADHFGDSVELSAELLGLVLSGVKRATAALASDFLAQGEPLPRIGSHWIACDGDGAPVVVLRTTELRLGPIDSVDDAFARDEGEDDRTRASWLEGHRRYWTRVCAARGEAFDESEDVVFERFEVVWPPEHADR
ncbi:ASCH domain-containing protein [Actinotalea sp. AC32]|nr:ASCH domain-containing protein [Actinotalea sp. AC32]